MEKEIISLQKPHWHALFFVIGAAVLIVVGLSVTVTTGLSSASDRVFAVEAMISGLITEVIFRKSFKKQLVFMESIPVPFIVFWPLLCLYVFVFTPFE